MDVQARVDQIVSVTPVMLKSPGARGVSEFYASPSQVVSHAAPSVSSRGKYRVTSNSLALGSQSNFSLSASEIISNITLNGTMSFPAARAPTAVGWGLKMIRQIEVTIPSSMIQNQVITGQAWREFLLLQCNSKEEREQLLANAGELKQVSANVEVLPFSIPIGQLLTHALGHNSQYPLDMSVLFGPMQINVTFYAQTAFSSTVANGAAVSTSLGNFASLYLTVDTTTLNDQMFAIRSLLALDAAFSYNLPVKYLQSYIQNFACDPAAGGDFTFNLTNAPAGILNNIILVVKPLQEINNTEAYVANTGQPGFACPGSVDLTALRLQYGGQDLFRADNYQEIIGNYRDTFCGDLCQYPMRVGNYTYNTVLNDTAEEYQMTIYNVPLNFNSKEVLRGHRTENLPSYSGSTLQLSFSIPATGSRKTSVPATAYKYLNKNITAVTNSTYQLEVLYVVSGILEMSNSQVGLQL